MAEAPTGKAQTRCHVLALEIGEFVHDLLSREPNRQQVEHVAHPKDSRGPTLEPLPSRKRDCLISVSNMPSRPQCTAARGKLLS